MASHKMISTAAALLLAIALLALTVEPATAQKSPRPIKISSPASFDEDGNVVDALGNIIFSPNDKSVDTGVSQGNGSAGQEELDSSGKPGNPADAQQAADENPPTQAPVQVPTQPPSAGGDTDESKATADVAAALIGDSPVPAAGNVVTRFPLRVTTEAEVYSESLDKCIKDLISDETDTNSDDWALVSSSKRDGDNSDFDVAYDSEISDDSDDDVRKKVTQYVNSGDLDRDIKEECSKEALVTTRGTSTRVSQGEGVSNEISGSSGRKILVGVLGGIGFLAALALLSALALAMSRRHKDGEMSSSDDVYSRNVFNTSAGDDDIEAGRVNVQEPELTESSISDSHHPVLTSSGKSDVEDVDRDSIPISTRDEHGNFVIDHESRQSSETPEHPHDYLIGEGPVTASTPHPPTDYVVRDSAMSGSSDMYSSLRESSGTDEVGVIGGHDTSGRLADARDSVREHYRNLRKDDE